MPKINSQCICCILNKYLNKFPKTAPEKDKLDYCKNVLKIIALADDKITPPELVALINDYKNDNFGFCDDYSEIKIKFNNLMLDYEAFYLKGIKASQNPLLTALKFSLLANYIDFGALDSVNESKLLEIPKEADCLDIDRTEFENLTNDLTAAENIVYLTDNCGEIVLDKLFISQISAFNPKLNITAIVKGGPVLNDATLSDAEAVGLSCEANVIDNGTNIAGTPLNKICSAARAAIDNADLIISKGQANFETLNGCKKNIYYLFLCKCDLYKNRFNVPQFTGLMLNEQRINNF